MSALKIGSLFSGYGGLDMAVESVTGARAAWVSDIDKGACKILAHRYPDVPNLGDLTAIDWSAVEPVDIITGGFPCQDLSHAGKRAGMADGTRSGLWSYMCDAINIIRPRLVVAENVRGLLSAEALRPVESCPWCVGDEPSLDLRALGAVLADLADIGYDASWYGLRAADVGACHGRFRVFLVAHPNGTGGDQWWDAVPGQAQGGWTLADDRGRSGVPVELLGTPTARMWKGSGPVGSASHDWLLEHGNVEAQVMLLPTPVTTDAAGTRNSTAVRSDPNSKHHAGVTLTDALLPTPAVNDMGKAYTPEEWDAWTAKMKAAHGNGNGHGKSLEIEAARLLPTPMVGSTSPASHGQISGQFRDAMDEAFGRFGDYAQAITRWESVTGRPAPAPTQPTGKGGAHRLSPRFTEWMMGLPDGWITDVPGITRNEALKACGNGVVPQQAAAALRRLLAVSEVAA